MTSVYSLTTLVPETLLIVRREKSAIGKSLGQASWSFHWAFSEFSCNAYHDILMPHSLEFPNNRSTYQMFSLPTPFLKFCWRMLN